MRDAGEEDVVEWSAPALRIGVRVEQQLVDVRLHGSGGGGFLFRVKDRKRKEAELALKILSPLRANDPVWVARFLQEARGIGALDHPHLVRVFDIFEANLPYYTMEFVSGLSLGERLDSDGPVPWSIGLDWVLQAAARVGDVVVVTNAQQGWVELACAALMPTLAPLLAGLRVVSARSLHEVPGKFEPGKWKRLCFAAEVAAHVGRHGPRTQPLAAN